MITLPNIRRFTAKRKRDILSLVHHGDVTVESVLKKYNISFDEFLSWTLGMKDHGLAGLGVYQSNQLRREENERESLGRRPDAVPAMDEQPAQAATGDAA